MLLCSLSNLWPHFGAHLWSGLVVFCCQKLKAPELSESPCHVDVSFVGHPRKKVASFWLSFAKTNPDRAPSKKPSPPVFQRRLVRQELRAPAAARAVVEPRVPPQLPSDRSGACGDTRLMCRTGLKRLGPQKKGYAENHMFGLCFMVRLSYVKDREGRFGDPGNIQR